MTKKDSERSKLYSNVKVIKIDPLGAALDEIGLTGGASKTTVKGLSKSKEKKLIDKIKKIDDKATKLKLKKFKPKDFIKIKD